VTLKRKNKNNTFSRLIENFSVRYGVISFCILGLFTVGLIAQMFRWQVAGHDEFLEMAEVMHLSDERLPSSRGTIFASDGSVLAVDEPVWGVYASLSSDERERQFFVEQRDEFIQTVCRILSLDEEDIDKKLNDDFRYILLKHEVSPDDKKALEESDIFGLYFEEEENRIYPDGNLASHLIGFVGKDDDGNDVGRYGLEGYYSGDLLGQEGFKYEEKDSLGNVILTGEYDPVIPRQGKNIVLTVRPGVQREVERVLEEGVKEHEAKSGSAIIMDPNTGKIIAMATYPNYDPNFYWNVSEVETFKNKAISDVYEYGSVNKPITLSMALEEEVITPETVCTDSKGYIQVYDWRIYTWDKQADGDLLPAEILSQSNNVCAAKTGMLVGIEKYYNYLRAFGIGDFIGIGLEDEATSYLMPLEYWTDLDVATASFGQAISATPLQIISAISAIANDGVRMRPYVVEKLYDDEETITISPEIASVPISEKTAKEVQEMMRTVVTDGEAKWWFNEVSNYSIAGKTGTAEIPKPNSPGYYEDKTNVTFIGFSPVRDSKMIMIVRLEEPKSHTLSAYTVVPVWVDMFKAISLELGIAPE
jgi:cell division protein FtsI/penicillin-binding protein 2